MNATWYDVLGVDPSASSEEIRAAWKQAIGDLEPTDRRFRACNQAAEVLLDPGRRAAYDAELTAVEDDRMAAADDPPAGTTAGPSAGATPAVTAVEAGPEPAESPARSGWVTPAWLLIALAAVTAVTTIAAAIIWFGSDSESEADVEDAVVEARSAAEDALPKLINYNWKTAERDRDQALRLTTGQAKEDLTELWDEAILPNVEEAKASATSTVVTSGVVRASDGGDQVQVVVVMDVESQNAAVTNTDRLPFTVTMTDSDGAWLVSEFAEGDAEQGSEDTTESPSEDSSPTGQGD